MRIAIPIFDGRISPRLDCASRFLLLEKKAGRLDKAEELHLGCQAPREMAERLRELAVDEIICGGLNSFYEQRLNEAGLKLITWVSGPVPEVIKAYCRGTLRPGQRCSGRRCQGRRANQGG